METPKDERMLTILQKVAEWNIKEKLITDCKKPKVIFTEMICSQIPTIEYLKFRKLNINSKHLIFRLKFYFRYSFFEDNFQPYDPTVRPYIIGEVFLDISSLNDPFFDFEIKDLRPWRTNFIGMSYLPFFKKSKLNGNNFYNKCILRQRSFEKKYRREFNGYYSSLVTT